MNTFEFEITIQSELAPGAGRWPIVVRCRQPDGLNTHVQETLELGESDRNQLVAFQENEKQYGILLGKALFKGEIQKTLIRALSFSDRDRRLRILLSIEVAENDAIKTLHWERLCAPIDSDGEWQLLARNQRIPFSMYIPTIIDRRFPTIGRRDLRALIIVASPANIGKYQLAPFDVKAAISGIVESLGDIPYDILANDITGALGPPTLIELSKQLTNARKPYTLLHVISHGMLLKDGDTALYWAQADNQVSVVTAENLIGELKNIGNAQKSLPHFAFLCTCESANPRAEGALGGLAQRLVRNLGMPAVIAMTRKVSVETGLALGRNFYRRLRESGEIDIALQEATAGLGERHDITVPALFSRLGGRPLFTDNLNKRELSDIEIEEAIEKLEFLLQERAPNASVLKQNFEEQVKTLKNTRGSELVSAREERRDALVELNNLCEQVLEISFDALALGKDPPPYIVECPFPGLSSFADAQYHKFFFGREELIKSLRVQLEKDNFLAVLGPSGSGKSSVVLAGLIPKLEKEDVRLKKAYIIKPGEDPLPKIEKFIRDIERYLLLVIDQFEEIFTLCEKEEDRKEFIATVLNLTENRKVIITIRADFLGECTFYPELRKRIETQQKLVGPMEPSELVSAMTMQANEGGLVFESGLSHQIFDDVQGEPGAMPLLQYALQELWQRRRGRWLCADEYQAIGRVEQAIAKTADRFYEDLPVAEKVQFQNIFLRLTRLDSQVTDGERRRDTRQRVKLEDLVPTGKTAAETKKLVQKLAGEGVRLVVTSINSVTGKEEVEVAHEALIRNWPTLQTWLNENRSDLQLRNEINEAAEQWKVHEGKRDRDDYLILQEGRLAMAEKLLLSSTLALNQDEKDYIEASVALRERRRLKERRLLKRKLFLATLGVIISTGFAILAGYQARNSEINKIEALLTSANASSNANQTLDAKIMSLQAAKAWQDSKLRRLWPEKDLEEKVTGMLSKTAYTGKLLNLIKSEQQDIDALAFSPDGKLIASSEKLDKTSNSKIILRYLSGHILYEFPTKIQVDSIAFSSDGKLLVAAGKNISSQGRTSNKKEKTLILVSTTGSNLQSYNVQNIHAELNSNDSQNLMEFNSSNDINSFAINPKYSYDDYQNIEKREKVFLVSSGEKGFLNLWNNEREKEREKEKETEILKRSPNRLQGDRKVIFENVVFSQKGNFVAARYTDRGFCLWKVKSRSKIYCSLSNSPTTNKDVTSDADIGKIQSLAFSPDEKLLVAAAGNGKIWVLETSGQPDRQPTQKQCHKGDVRSLAFSPDGEYLVTGGQDNKAILWDKKELMFSNKLACSSVKEDVDPQNGGSEEPHKGDIYSVGFLDNKEELQESAGENDQTDQQEDHKEKNYLFFTAGYDKTIRLWKMDSYRSIPSALVLEMPSLQDKIALSPNGKRLATGGSDENIRLWDTTGKQYTVFKSQTGEPVWSTFSPDSKFILTEEKDVARLRDTSGKELSVLGGHQGKVWGWFSENSQLVITMATEDNTARLWDTSGKLLAVLGGHQGRVWGQFSENSQLVITEGEQDNAARLWDTSGKLLAILEGSKGIGYFNFSADSQRIITMGDDSVARLWDASGKLLAVLGNSRALPKLSEDSNFILVFGTDGLPSLWDRNGKLLRALKEHKGANMGRFSPDSQRFITFGHNGTACVWSRSGKLMRVLTGHKGEVDGKFSDDSKRIITTGEDNTPRLWDSSGEQLAILSGHKGAVKGEFSPDSQLVITYGEEDGTALLWDSSGKLLSILSANKKIESAGFSDDSKLIITTEKDEQDEKDESLNAPKTKRFWDRNGKQLDVSRNKKDKSQDNQAPGNQQPQQAEGPLSSQGELLVATRSDGSIAVWKTSGENLAVFKADVPQGNPSLSSDGKLVLTFGNDGIDHLWRIKGMNELIAMNCNWLDDYLKNPNNGLSKKEREVCKGVPLSERSSEQSGSNE